TCEPVPDVYLEMWHCNSTGVYSGVVASGNGDSSDETNIDKTFLRGIQQTDSDGVAQFETLFPGHCESSPNNAAPEKAKANPRARHQPRHPHPHPGPH